MPIGRIYFDSNILIGNAWPEPSPKLARVFEAARFIKVELFLPALVEAECEHEFRRRFVEKKSQVETRLGHLAAHTDLFTKPRMEFPATKAVVDRYREVVNALKDEWGLVTSPLTRRTAEDLLEMSAAHTFPFPDRDGSFRDATIMLSIIEHLEAAGRVLEAVLVTNDAFFQSQRLKSGSVLEVTKDLDDVFSRLLDMAVDDRLKAWSDDTDRAKAALEADRDAIERFLTGTLEFPVGGFVGPKVREVHGLKLTEIVNVATPRPLNRAADVRERLSFTAKLTLHQTVEVSRWPAFSDPRIRIGSPATEEVPLPLAAFAGVGQTEVTEIDVEKKALVQAEAHIVNNEYVGFNYTTARLTEDLNPALRGLMAATAEP